MNTKETFIKHVRKGEPEFEIDAQVWAIPKTSKSYLNALANRYTTIKVKFIRQPAHHYYQGSYAILPLRKIPTFITELQDHWCYAPEGKEKYGCVVETDGNKVIIYNKNPFQRRGYESELCYTSDGEWNAIPGVCSIEEYKDATEFKWKQRFYEHMAELPPMAEPHQATNYDIFEPVEYIPDAIAQVFQVRESEVRLLWPYDEYFADAFFKGESFEKLIPTFWNANEKFLQAAWATKHKEDARLQSLPSLPPYAKRLFEALINGHGDYNAYVTDKIQLIGDTASIKIQASDGTIFETKVDVVKLYNNFTNRVIASELPTLSYGNCKPMTNAEDFMRLHMNRAKDIPIDHIIELKYRGRIRYEHTLGDQLH